MKKYKDFKAIKQVNTSKAMVLLSLAIVLLLLANAYYYFNLPSVLGQERKLPIYSVGTDEKKIAISFDAAWGNEHTRPILDILDRYGVKTTFFLVKFWAEKYPEDVKEMSMRGHEVQNHSATHPDMTKLSPEKIEEEVKLTEETIKMLTGKESDLFRPPFGAYDNKVIDALEGLGYKIIQWSVDSLDWKEISKDQIVERVVTSIEPGSIVLFHNDAAHVEEYLPEILEKIISKGYEIIPIGDLIYRDDYHMDHTGKQIKN
jgi:polysaccharide deacetylase family sporulation protein PdaB